jgi:kynureninase
MSEIVKVINQIHTEKTNAISDASRFLFQCFTCEFMGIGYTCEKHTKRTFLCNNQYVSFIIKHMYIDSIKIVVILNAIIEYFNLVQVQHVMIVRRVVLAFLLVLISLSALFPSQSTNKKKSTVSEKKSLTASSDESHDIKILRGTGGQDKNTFLNTVMKNSSNQQVRDQLNQYAIQNNTSIVSEQFAKFMDKKYEKNSKRNMFHYPDSTVYLCGNSLGLQPKQLKEYVNEELDKWSQVAVQGHFTGKRPWFDIEDYVVNEMAKIVGAKPIEVAVMNTLTTNLHLLLVAFYRPTSQRYKIIIEENPFPSDMHAIVSHLITRDQNPEDALIQVGPRPGEDYIRQEDILKAIRDSANETALVLFSGVHFMSGQLFDIEEITRVGHENGCVVGFDLAHAAGNIDVQLHDWNVDFACWCTYKYMNSGPGSISAIFVHEKHAYKSLEELPRFAGWWGHKRSTRFKLTNKFDPQEGAAGFQLSNPIILGMVSVQASLDVFNKTTMKDLRAKSFLLTMYLEMCLESELSNFIHILTPRDPKQRGCQLSLRIVNSKQTLKQVMEQLEHKGVICDEREPDIIRVAPTPLYNSFEDILRFVFTLKSILQVK